LAGRRPASIAGKKEIIARVRRYPLFRALRVDKLTIAALEATLGALSSRGLGRKSPPFEWSRDSAGAEAPRGEFHP